MKTEFKIEDETKASGKMLVEDMYRKTWFRTVHNNIGLKIDGGATIIFMNDGDIMHTETREYNSDLCKVIPKVTLKVEL
jgi:hypothetical protein